MLFLLVALATGASPVLLQDLAPGAAIDAERYLDVDTGADPNVLVIHTPFWGAELFTVLDGTRSLVADICPGPCSSSPGQLTRLNGKVLFLTGVRFAPSGPGDPKHDLWATDGTTAGTVRLATDVRFAPRLTPLEGQMLFSRVDGVWVTDGTREGTVRAAWGKERVLLSSQATPAHRFAATRRTDGGCELFVSGTDVRNAMPLQMPAPTEDCGSVAVLGARAFLSFTTGVWRFDATGGAPVLIDAQGKKPVRAGSQLFFFSGFGSNTLALARSLGEPGDAVPLGTVPSAGLRQAIAIGSTLVYAVVDGVGLVHLHASDGTVAGTAELGTTNDLVALVAAGPVAYAVVRNQNASLPELVETDGTKSGTVVLPGIHPALPEQGHSTVTGHALALAFIGKVVNETGVFRLRPGEDPQTVFPQAANPRDSVSAAPITAGPHAFFVGDGRVYRTDGTPEGTAPIADGGLVGIVRDRLLIDDGTLSLSAMTFDGGDARVLGAFDRPVSANFGGTAVVSSAARLAVTDGTPAGTRGLLTLDGLPRAPLMLGDGRAVFPTATTLWFTDGTQEGSSSVAFRAIGEAVAGEDAVWAVVTGGAAASLEVRRVTASGSTVVHSGRTLPEHLTALGDDLFFAVGGELWHAPAGGPARLLGGLTQIRGIAAHRGRLMVLGEGQMFEWTEEDGLVQRATAPGATFLKSAGVHLFANVASIAEGQELHYWNERLGFFLSTGDLSPGAGSSSPSPPVALGPRVLFTAWKPDTGREPFVWEVPAADAHRPRGCGCGATPGVWLLALLFWAKRRPQ